VGPRRAQLIGGKWVEKECCRLCHPSSAIRSDLHSIKSDRALIKPSNLPMANAQKGQKGPRWLWQLFTRLWLFVVV